MLIEYTSDEEYDGAKAVMNLPPVAIRRGRMQFSAMPRAVCVCVCDVEPDRKGDLACVCVC
jgi:hypothetical protein